MNAEFPLVAIEDVSLKVDTWNPRAAQTQVPFEYIDISSVDPIAKEIRGTQRLLPNDAPSRARQLVRAGDVLVSTVRPNLNGVAVVPRQLDGATASTGFAVLRPNPRLIDGSYLLSWLTSPRFVRDMVRRATGASYPAVSESMVCRSQLPLPPLEDQQRITAIFDKVRSLRRNSRAWAAMLDCFLRARFTELFGDVVHDSMGWPERALGDVSEIVSGVTIGRELGGRETVEIPYMRVANVQDGYVDLDEVKTTAATPEEVTRFSLEVGDVLLTEGGDRDKLGRGAVWKGTVELCIHQNHVFRVRPNRALVRSEYLSALLGSALGKRYFLKAAKQTTGIASINRTQLAAFPVRLPPIEDQDKFEQVAGSVESLRSRVTVRNRELERLCASLGDSAFGRRAVPRRT